jgi:hypothetical protein
VAARWLGKAVAHYVRRFEKGDMMILGRTVLLVLGLLVVVSLATTGSAKADDETVAVAADRDETEAADFQTPLTNWLPAYCRFHNEAVFYTLSWGRLGQFLAADAGPCADYYIAVPARDADKTQPRPGEAARIRALGLRFHPMAEFHVATWASWIAAAPGRTWTAAAHEFRRRMAATGFDLWAVNEFPVEVRANAGSWRADMRELVNALAEGAPGMSYTPGTVFTIGPDQRTADAAPYKAELKDWLSDDVFWTGFVRPVRFFAQEVYADTRTWGVADASRETRARNLSAYSQHLATLAEDDPRGTSVAAQFLRETHVPLMNASWRWNFGFGWTMVDIDTMRSFVSEQAHANRHYAGSHPQLAPGGRIGFAYVQRNAVDPLPAPVFNAQTALLLERLASAIHHAYDNGGGSPMGACGAPGDHVWCDGALESATFNDAWHTFDRWDD